MGQSQRRGEAAAAPLRSLEQFSPRAAARVKSQQARLDALRAPAGPRANQRPVRQVARPPLRFEPNLGQFDSEARFFARGPGFALFLTAEDAVLALHETPPSDQSPRPSGVAAPQPYSTSFLRMKLAGAQPASAVEGRELLPSRSHYFLGNDPGKWRSNVPNYARVGYSQVYPGVDLVYYANQEGRLQYDFIVAPGADPGQIKLAFDGVDRIETESGDLVLHAGKKQVRFQKPFIYQEVDGSRVEVAGGYLLLPEAGRKDRFEVAFELAAYDAARPLIIDPVLVYSSYFGSTGWDEARSIAVDRLNGDFFVTAITTATDFPLRSPLFLTHSGNFDAVIAKFTATGELLFSSYFGGAGIDMFEDVVVRHSDGDIFAAGWTDSTNFPTLNALQPNYSGSSGTDAVVLRLAWDGSFLDFSTYLGGTGSDTIEAIALDATETPHFRGRTNSTNFPATPGVFQPSLVGSHNMFVTKMAPDGTSLLFSTYLGGGDEGLGQRGKSIAVDWLGDVYVTGNTQSANYPVVNAFQSILPGVRSAVVSKIKSDGTQLLYSTYLGGSGLDVGASIAVDLSRRIYILGNTASTDFPTMNPLQAARASTGNNTDLFVTKLEFSGELGFSTYLGGATHQEAGFMILGPDADLYLTGWTQSADFPLVKPLQSFGGQGDAVVVRLGFDPVGDGAFNPVIRFSTFLGGGGFDIGRGIDIGHFGQLYVAGDTSSANFPATATPFQSTFLGGNWDAFTSIISLPDEHCVSPAHRQTDLGCAFTTIQSAVDAAGPGDLIWVYPGLPSDPERHVYQEAVFINKSLHLMGAGGEHEKPLVAPAIGASAIYAFTATSNSGMLGSITIRNFEVDWDGGISMRAASDVEIANNDIYAQVGVSLDPNGIGSDFRIIGNRVRDNARRSMPVQYGISVFSESRDVFVVGNDVSSCDPNFSIALQFDGFFLRTVVAGNIVTQCYIGIYFEHREDPSFPAGETVIFGNQIQALEQGIDVFTQIGPEEEGYVSNLFISDNVVGGGPSQALTETPDHVQRGFEIGFTNGSNTAVVNTGFNHIGETRTTRVAVEGMGLGLEGVPPGFQSSSIPAGLQPTDQFVHITGAFGVRLTRVMFLVDSSQIGGIDPATLKIFHCSNLDGNCFGWTELPSNAFAFGETEFLVWTDAPQLGILTLFGGEQQAPNPVPVLALLNPASVNAGTGDLTLTATAGGASFLAGSVLRWNGEARPTTVLDSTSLTAQILAADLASAGTAQVTVFNPAPGGGESNALQFTILAVPPSNPVNLTVVKLGTGQGMVTSDPAGISCGATCGFTFGAPVTVVLTAVADAGTTFVGWRDCPSPAGNTCTVEAPVAANITVRASFTPELPEGLLYAGNSAGRALRTIDPFNADILMNVQMTFASGLGDPSNSTGLATHPHTGELYAVLRRAAEDSQGRVLATVDPATGVATRIGNLGDRFAAIAFDCGGNLYGVTGDGAIVPESLFLINPHTAETTFLRFLGRGDDGEALGYNPDDRLLYHGSGLSDVIFESLDPFTLQTTDIPLSANLLQDEVISLVYWRSQGVFLWGTLDGNIYRVTPQGQGTFVATVGSFTPKGLAFASGASMCSDVNPVDMALSLSGPTTAEAGATVNYLVEVQNASSTQAARTRVVLDLPANVSSHVIAPGAGSCGSEERPVCALGLLGPLETVAIAVQLELGAPGMSTLRAGVSSDHPDPVPGNNVGQVTINVSPAPGAVPVLYSVTSREGSGGEFLRMVNPDTGATTGQLPLDFGARTAEIQGGQGLALHPITGELWAILYMSDIGSSSRELVRINPFTGRVYSVGNLGDNFAGLTFACNGTLYGVTGRGANVSGSLFSINTSNAQTTFLRELDASRSGHMLAFNPLDGRLYHGTGGFNNVLFQTIDLSTLQLTAIDVSGTPLQEGEVQALTWAAHRGVFYWKRDNSSSGPLFRVTGAGVPTLVGNMDHQSKGLAFLGGLLPCDEQQPPDDGELYSVSTQDINLRTLHPDSGLTLSSMAMSLAGDTVRRGNGLATNPVNGEMFAVIETNSTSDRALAKVNPSTGQLTLVGGLDEWFNAIAFDCSGRLFGVSGREGSFQGDLWLIDPATGTASRLMNLHPDLRGAALALNPVDGMLYFATGGRSGVPVQFERIHPFTLARTPIDISASALEEDEVRALTYSVARGAFLWHQADSSGTVAGRLFHVNPVGATTLAGTLDHRSKGLAFRNPPASCTVTGIGTQLVADYRFQDTLASSAGNPPDLQNLGANTFISDSVGGQTTRVLQFPQGSGVALLPTTGVIPSQTYTISAVFRLDTVSGYRKLTDFKNRSSDSGFYVRSGLLNFFPVMESGAPVIFDNTYTHVVLTRDDQKNVRGYVNGVEQFSFVDSSDLAVIDSSNMLRFFQDDLATSGEDSAGAVSRIRLFSGALTPQQVADLQPILAPPALDLGVSAGAPVAAADTLTYPVQIVNTSANSASSVTLVNNVVNFRIVGAIPSQGSCSVSVQFIQCSLGTVAVGSVVTVQIVVQPPAAGWASQAITVNATGPGLQQFSKSLTINWGENQPPLARAGSDRVVSGAGPAGAQVTLDGRASSDPEGNTLTYRWTGPFPEGSGTVFGSTPTVTMPLGAHAVTLVVSDGQLESAPAAVSVTVSDFTLAVNGAAAATVKAGQSAGFTVALGSRHGPFTNPVALACADLPAGFGCAFSNPSPAPGENGATVTLTVTTSAQSASAGARSLTVLAGLLGLPLAGVVLLSAAGGRRRRWLLLGVLLAAAALQVACGSEVRFQSQPPTSTFSIKVVGTSGGLTHSSGITVTTQR